MTPLTMAILNAHFDLAAILLAKGADPNANGCGWTALHQIAWTRRPNVGRPLPFPVPSGTVDSLELTKMLLARGADPNARETREPQDSNRNVMNRIGSTPLVLAAKSLDLELIRVLLDSGADPHIATAEGVTPFMAAAGIGIYKIGESPGTNAEALEAVQLLWKLGADVNAADANGDTALHGAVLRAADSVVKFLAENGADLNAVNKKGWAPLTIAEGVFHVAAFYRSPSTAALLRTLGAKSEAGR
jgi:ankyrin repeat protein